MSTLWQQGSPVQSIAFDDPWLAASLENGSALLLNVDAAMRGGRSGKLFFLLVIDTHWQACIPMHLTGRKGGNTTFPLAGCNALPWQGAFWGHQSADDIEAKR